MPIASPDRIDRVNSIMKREIADLVETAGLNDGGCLVSVTKVQTSSMLRNATVFISVYGGTPERHELIITELERRRGELQNRIAKDIVLKYTPVLRFELDRNIEDGDRVLSIIRELEKNDGSPE